MAEQNKLELAKKVYDTLCAAIEARDWRYEKKQEALVVTFSVSGEDIPMEFLMAVDAERQLIRLLSPLPFSVPEERRLEGAIATCVATYGLADGSFDYDIETGRIFFRQTASFRESIIGEGLFRYMIDCSCSTVDKYNDRLLFVSKGQMSIEDFMASES